MAPPGASHAGAGNSVRVLLAVCLLLSLSPWLYIIRNTEGSPRTPRARNLCR